MTYYKVDASDEVLVKDTKPITSIREKSAKDIEKVKSKKTEIEIRGEKKKTEAKEIKPEIPDDLEERISKKESEPENEAALEDYRLEVREKIKSILEKNGERFIQEGDIYVRFVIKRDGTLEDLVLYKKSGKGMSALEAIVIKSIEEASPFPPFDELMKEKELLFKLPIRFSRR